MQESAVHPAGLDPFLQLRVIAEEQFIVDVGIILLKSPDDVWSLVLFLGEYLSPAQVLGAVCILGGALMGERLSH